MLLLPQGHLELQTQNHGTYRSAHDLPSRVNSIAMYAPLLGQPGFTSDPLRDVESLALLLCTSSLPTNDLNHTQSLTMAPTRPDLKFAEVAIANKESDRVAKRPKRGKRGYHTFKNGMLNVKPKGSEINV